MFRIGVSMLINLWTQSKKANRTECFPMPTGQAKALLTDIGTEELAHMEMIAALVCKLT